MSRNPFDESDEPPQVDPRGVPQGATQDQVAPRGVPRGAGSAFGGQALPDFNSHLEDYLADRAVLRAVHDGIAEGLSVAAGGDELGISVELVVGMAESLDRGVDAEEGSYEVIVRAHVEGTSRRALVDLLSAWQYANDPGQVLGSWAAVARLCRLQGLLTNDEVSDISARRDHAG